MRRQTPAGGFDFGQFGHGGSGKGDQERKWGFRPRLTSLFRGKGTPAGEASAATAATGSGRRRKALISCSFIAVHVIDFRKGPRGANARLWSQGESAIAANIRGWPIASSPAATKNRLRRNLLLRISYLTLSAIYSLKVGISEVPEIPCEVPSPEPECISYGSSHALEILLQCLDGGADSGSLLARRTTEK
jgi:hypothetical protein